MSPPAQLLCIRCQTPVIYGGAHKLVFDDLAMIRPKKMLDVYTCPHCGHVEFFDQDTGRELRLTDDVETAVGKNEYDNRGF